jgi:hypothetical protein
LKTSRNKRLTDLIFDINPNPVVHSISLGINAHGMLFKARKWARVYQFSANGLRRIGVVAAREDIFSRNAPGFWILPAKIWKSKPYKDTQDKNGSQNSIRLSHHQSVTTAVQYCCSFIVLPRREEFGMRAVVANTSLNLCNSLLITYQQPLVELYTPFRPFLRKLASRCRHYFKQTTRTFTANLHPQLPRSLAS